MEIEAFGGTYLVSCMPIFAKDGHIEKVIHIATDITDRVLAERALQESEEKYRSLFDHSTDAILLTKPDGTILDANPAACKMFGRSREEIVRIGRNGLVVRTDPHLHTALESRAAYGDATAEIMMIRANGEKFPVEITSAMFVDVSGQQKTSIIIRDITERRQREEENKRISEKLRALAARLQAVREEERTRIAREIHDELGGALTGIKIDLALLIKEADAINEESLKRPLLDQMISTTRIIDKTVRAVRRIATELRPGILDDLGIIAALKWQLNDFQKRTGIHCHWTSSLENIDLDGHHLTALFRIFQETLTNVGRHANATEVKAQLKKERDTYVLEVQDNGKGMTTGDMENKGSLGILGMRERALTFGGCIEIEGKSGKGTKVTVKVPVR